MGHLGPQGQLGKGLVLHPGTCPAASSSPSIPLSGARDGPDSTGHRRCAGHGGDKHIVSVPEEHYLVGDCHNRVRGRGKEGFLGRVRSRGRRRGWNSGYKSRLGGRGVKDPGLLWSLDLQGQSPEDSQQEWQDRACVLAQAGSMYRETRGRRGLAGGRPKTAML